VEVNQLARQTLRLRHHVLIAGYGRCGQNLARLLDSQEMSYVALDLDPDRIRQAKQAGESVLFGDATQAHTLQAAGLARASAVVISYLTDASAIKCLHHVQTTAPHVPVIVRTTDDAHLTRLLDAGATEVVPEAIEGSLMLAGHTLALLGVPMRKVLRLIQDQRDQRYGLLRGYFHGSDDDETAPDAQDHERLLCVTLPSGSSAVGQTWEVFSPLFAEVRLMNLRRAQGQRVLVAQGQEAKEVLQAGDTLVLSGRPVPLAQAQAALAG
jgi:CPA2 family monovalent cation:H+ antiporter-2